MRDHFTPEFEETMRATVAVPPAGPEFVHSLWERIVEHPSPRPAPRPGRNGFFRSIWTGHEQRRSLRVAYLIPLVLLVLLGLFFVTPAGRVMAEYIAAFFTRTESNWKPIPAEYNQTAAPAVNATETQPPTPTQTAEITPLLFSRQEQKSAMPDGLADRITREQAAALAPYSLKEPINLPNGYQFSYAVFFPENQNVMLVYAYRPDPKGEMIMLTLSPTLIQDEVGANAVVEPVTIGDFEGEMVRGGWLVLAGEDHETWEPRLPVTTLRWFDGELYIKLQFHLNEPSSPSFLDLPQMLAVAETIGLAPVDEPQPTPLLTSESVQEMEAQVSFDLLEPDMLPLGYELTLIEQVPGMVQVYAEYRPPIADETGPRLSISQIPLSELLDREPQSYPPDIVEMVDIFGSQGRFMEGVDDGSGSYPSWYLFWETSDLALSIWYFPGPGIDADQAKAMMIEIAQSMR